MTDMTEWARAEAERKWPMSLDDVPEARLIREARRHGFERGVRALADRLLSDEAMAAGDREAESYGAHEPYGEPLFGPGSDMAKSIIRAALAAVTTTKGDEK